MPARSTGSPKRTGRSSTQQRPGWHSSGRWRSSGARRPFDSQSILGFLPTKLAVRNPLLSQRDGGEGPAELVEGARLDSVPLHLPPCGGGSAARSVSDVAKLGGG